MEKPIIGGIGRREVHLKGLRGHCDTTVANRSITVRQDRANDPDSGHEGRADQLLEPIRLQHFDIVVQEEHEIAVAASGAEIDETGVMEGGVITKNLMRSLTKVRQSLGIDGAVVHNGCLLYT